MDTDVHTVTDRPASSASRRIIGYDVARALAVFGMVIVNYAVVMDLRGEHWWLAVSGALEGRAAATFVVLAGVGLSLLTRSARERDDRVRLSHLRTSLLKRSLILFAAGSLYTPIWPADILHFYGLYIALGAVLLTAPDRRLWQLALGLVLLFVVLVFALDYERGWVDWVTLEYEGLWTPRGAVRHLFFNGFHPVIPWAAFLLVGMVLGRIDLRQPRTCRRVMGWGLLAVTAAELESAFAIRLLSSGAGDAERELIRALLGTEPMPPMPHYMVAGAGLAAAVIAGCVALTKTFPRWWLWKPLASTGQMALTLYVAHVVVGMSLLDAVGRLQGQSVGFGMSAAIEFCIVAALVSFFWRKRFAHGPLEALVRRLSAPRA